MKDIRERLLSIIDNSHRARRSGRTTALVEAAAKIGAGFVCAHEAQRRTVMECVPLARPWAITIDTNLRGSSSPVIYDHYALEYLAHEALREFSRLENQRNQIEDKLIKFLWHATGGVLSYSNYPLESMVEALDEYIDRRIERERKAWEAEQRKKKQRRAPKKKKPKVKK